MARPPLLTYHLFIIHTCSDGQRPSLHLVSHFAYCFWGWTNKQHPSILARLGKVCSLREKTIAWVDSIHVVVLYRERDRHMKHIYSAAVPAH